MKIKTGLFLLTFSIVSTFNLSTAFAQYEPYMQVGLPEGAKVRLGQGAPVGLIAYSPNMTDAWSAVASHIGIWIYDADTLQPRDLLMASSPNIYSMHSSPDGKTLGTGFRDGTVELWDVTTGDLRRTFTAHSNRVSSMRFNPDGNILATGSWDGTVRLWYVATGILRDTFEGEFSPVRNVSFSPDGSILAAGTNDGVRLWDVATGTLRNTFVGHTTAVFSPDGSILTTWGGSNKVSLWDVATGALFNTLTVPKNTVERLRFNPAGDTLATGSWDGIVRLWDVATGILQNTLETDTYDGPGLYYMPQISNMYFSPDGNTLVTIHNHDNKMRLWDVVSGTLSRTLQSGGVNSVRFSPDGNTFTFWTGGRARVLDVATGEWSESLKWNWLPDVQSVHFSPDGSTLAIGFTHGTVRLWDVSTGVFRVIQAGGDWDHISNMSFNPDGSILAIGLRDSVSLWDVAAGTVQNILRLHNPNAVHISSLSFSSDGSTLAAGIERSYFVEMPSVIDEPDDLTMLPPVPIEPEFPTLGIWDVSTGQQKPSLGKYIHSIYSVCFSSDGRTLAVAARHGDEPIFWDDSPGAQNKTNIDLWDTSTGKLTTTLEAPNSSLSGPVIATEVCFSPDGRILAAVSGSTIHLWDVAADTYRTFSTEHTNIIFSLSFSPDSSTLATGSWDGTVRLWNVSTLSLRKTLTVSPWGVRSVSFSPDGETLATGSAFGTVLLWEVETERVMPQLTEDINGDGVVNIQDMVMVAAQFGQTGENIADVNEDGVVNIQDLVLVAAAFNNASAAPTIRRDASKHLTSEVVQQWLDAAKRLERPSATAQRGISVLETLLAALTPKKTALLPNYPNPFNPETWIPYQLAKRADVSISIYSAGGKLVRTLKLGQQVAAVYESRNRAAYWDGKNEVGESVASGVYFYTLKAGDFTTTRKMLIRK